MVDLIFSKKQIEYIDNPTNIEEEQRTTYKRRIEKRIEKIRDKEFERELLIALRYIPLDRRFSLFDKLFKEIVSPLPFADVMEHIDKLNDEIKSIDSDVNKATRNLTKNHKFYDKKIYK